MRRRLIAFAGRSKRRALGLLWLAAWSAVLLVPLVAWGRLGGLVDERIRWLHRFTLGAALIVGCELGRWVRAEGGVPTVQRHVSRLRRWVLPPAAALAGSIVALRALGRDALIGVAFVTLLAYLAGFDLGAGILALFGEGDERAPHEP